MTDPGSPPPRRRLAGAPAIVALFAAAAGAAAVLLSRLVFPLLSIDNDDAINRLHADAIAHGHLFPPTLGLPNAIRPWLAAVVDHHFVLKYAPVVPGLIAASQLVTGGRSWYLALVAAAVVVVTFLLADALLEDRRQAVAATLLVSGSPLVVVQSGLLLSYLPTFLFLELFALLLLRGSRRDGGGALLLAGAGLALGVAFFVRPYDAVLLGLPLLVWAFPLRRPPLRSWLAFALGTAVPLAAFLAFNAAATGSLLQPPFSLLEPADTLGFGNRKLFPADPPHHFALAQGLNGVGQHLALLGLWAAGGLVLVVAAVIVAVRQRRRLGGPLWAVVATLATLPLGYLVFWGPWNASVMWGGPRYLGPFYFLPLLLPLSLLGARALASLAHRRRALGIALATVLALTSMAVTVRSVEDNLGFSRQLRQAQRLVDRPGGRRLVLASLPTPFLMHPNPVVANRWDADGALVFAVAGGGRDVDVAQHFGDRAPYRLRFADDLDRPHAHFRGRLEAVHLVTADHVAVHVAILNPTGARLSLAVTFAGRRSTAALGTDAAFDEVVDLTTSRAAVEGRSAADLPRAGGSSLVVQVLDGPTRSKVVAEDRIPVRVAGGEVTALLPTGVAWVTGPHRPPRLVVTG